MVELHTSGVFSKNDGGREDSPLMEYCVGVSRPSGVSTDSLLLVRWVKLVLVERYGVRWEDERYNCGSGKDKREVSYSYALAALLCGRPGTSRLIRGPGCDELRRLGEDGVCTVYTGLRRSAQRLIGERDCSCADGEGFEGGAAPAGMVTWGRERWAMDQPQTGMATKAWKSTDESYTSYGSRMTHLFSVIYRSGSCSQQPGTDDEDSALSVLSWRLSACAHTVAMAGGAKE